MGSDEHVQRIPCPKTMPAFDGDNPVQALYLKKRGVEKLLDKAVGKSLANSFVEEKKTNIAKESMLILRTIDGEFDPTKLETIPSFDDDNETSEQDSATTNTEASTIEFNDDYDDKCPDVSHYDSDESRSNSDDESDWSLPGIEPDAQIRYVELENSMVFVDDGHFYDDDRRDRKIVQDPRKSKMSFPQFAFCHSTELCHSEELMTTYNDMIAAVAEAKNKVEDATAKAAAEGEAEKKAEEETSAAKAEAKKKAEEKDPTLAETEAEAKMKAEEEAAVIEAKKKAEEEATAKAAAETEAKKKADVEAAAAVAAAEAEKEAQEEAKQKAEEEASVAAEAEKKEKEAAAKAAAEAEAMKPKSEEQEVTEVGYTQVGILDMYMDMVRCA
eukprot:CAMPEP_0116105624 /NCGR_PEP_ID=MMETSP0327-20121206/15143_1 /TAXON_ID=44447 /ORGANISM="Pseudo-nitzschia delicatissima, Strain B596" /LENGTH=385 /DNA_ID=CAMNT_0003598065 /DNA_START=82 /DNA_END=1239 /DNA_ORIENTATION=+